MISGNVRVINVAYITHYAELYGANRSLLDLMLQLRESGRVSPHLISASEGPAVSRAREMGIPVLVLPFSPWMTRRVFMGGPHHRLMQWWGYRRAAMQRAAKDRGLLPAARRAVTGWKIDLVHANSSVIRFGHSIAAAMRLPLVWHVREFAFRHYHLYPDGGLAAFRRALRQADRVIAISDAVKQEMEHYMDGERIVRIYNGIIRDEEMRHPSQRPLPQEGISRPFTFALIGYIHRSKGQLEALEAFAKLCAKGLDVRLVLAGSGNDASLKELLAELDLGHRVELAGFVERPQDIYERADALVVCSRHEALGRVTIEAMAHRLPVIGHASGGTPELIAHGRTGYLYRTGVELLRYMEELATSPATARKMGISAFDSLGDRFSVEARSMDVLRLYEEILAEGKE